MMKYSIPDCKDFTGYKPCHPGPNGETCINPKKTGKKILIINIGALGAVLNTTTLLPALKRKYPESTVYWLTAERAEPLLEENPYVDRILKYDFSSVLTLQQIEFDIVCNTDKVQEICAFTNTLKAGKKLGFGLNENSVIFPLNEGAVYGYTLGINNKLKFEENTRSYVSVLREICELDDIVDPYIFNFTEEEREFIKEYKNSLALESGKKVVGINTGSSPLFSNKRIPEEHIKIMINEVYKRNDGRKVVLLGGIEDIERNKIIAAEFPDMVINTPTDEGLRRGLCYMDICDYVFSADSLGMHMAIALGKEVVVYYNVTCPAEIELYGKGGRVISQVECSPCWKQDCDKDLKCLEEDISGKMLDVFDGITG